MDRHPDWLEQTWEIKKDMARKYAGTPMSQQLRDMHVRVLEEFRNRGWKYPEPAITGNVGAANAGKPQR